MINTIYELAIVIFGICVLIGVLLGFYTVIKEAIKDA